MRGKLGTGQIRTEENSVTNMNSAIKSGGANQPVTFLIVDDDKVSIMAMKRALRKMNVVNPVVTAGDGQEALDILRGEAGKEKILTPFLVTLDLNMPRMGGIEFLEEIRDDPDLCSVVVFVMTTSDAPQDIASAYERNVAGYIVKENAAESFAKALDMIEVYSKLVVLPS